MGMLDKLKFWKKEEEMPSEYPRPSELSVQEQSAPMDMEHMGMPRPAPGITEPPMEPSVPSAAFPQPQAFQQAAMSSDQQLQLISSKLDTIKAQLETVLQRLERLERKDDLSPYQQRWRNI